MTRLLRSACARNVGREALVMRRPRGRGNVLVAALAGLMVALSGCGAQQTTAPLAAASDATRLDALGPASWRAIRAAPGRAKRDLARTLRRLHLGVLSIHWRPAVVAPHEAVDQPEGVTVDPRPDHVEAMALLSDGRTARFVLTALTPAVSLAPDRPGARDMEGEPDLALIAIGVRVGRLGDPQAERSLAEAVGRVLTGPAAPVRYAGFELPSSSRPESDTAPLAP